MIQVTDRILLHHADAFCIRFSLIDKRSHIEKRTARPISDKLFDIKFYLEDKIYLEDKVYLDQYLNSMGAI